MVTNPMPVAFADKRGPQFIRVVELNRTLRKKISKPEKRHVCKQLFRCDIRYVLRQQACPYLLTALGYWTGFSM